MEKPQAAQLLFQISVCGGGRKKAVGKTPLRRQLDLERLISKANSCILAGYGEYFDLLEEEEVVLLAI